MKPAPDSRLDDEDSDPVEVCRAIALRRLGRLPQTESQLRDYLLRKGADPAAVDQVVSRLRDVGLVNDAEYAGMWVRSRRRTRNAGANVIRRELQQRGVAADVIEAALADEPVDERELALELAVKRWSALARLPEEQRANRVVGMLVRRGHSVGTAWSVVGELRTNSIWHS